MNFIQTFLVACVLVDTLVECFPSSHHQYAKDTEDEIKSIDAMTVLRGEQCKGVIDGKYPLADVFTYLECRNQKHHYKICPTKKVKHIFDAQYRECRPVESLNLKTFCKYPRQDGDYRDPWNCHYRIQCREGRATEISCKENMVYNYYTFECVHEREFPCDTAFDKQQCNGKESGEKYAIPDTMSYGVCLHGEQGTSNIREKCGLGEIFDAESLRCLTEEHFEPNLQLCGGRGEGTYWRNPWDCHSWLECNGGRQVKHTCADAGDVYDPYQNLCTANTTSYNFPESLLNKGSKRHYRPITLREESCFTCENVFGTQFECSHRVEGNYPMLGHMYDYWHCVDGRLSPNHWVCVYPEIFYAPEQTCKDYQIVGKKRLCDGRNIKHNLQNPWDCHNFVACPNGVETSMPCAPGHNPLVFEPTVGNCTYDCDTDPFEKHCDLCLDITDGHHWNVKKVEYATALH